ncbi:hypothetical protein [Fontivita pretiosa]|uniref:hypothetical protein n=1 Tax=Fontivita pretiosa TaxID=2989684 RepID=UPI003D18722B
MKMRLHRAALCTIGVGLLALLAATQTSGQALQIFNPNWNITLTDAGYSDWLYDNTPGYEGREYLCGEWAAAVSYKIGAGPGATTVNPTWLEPQFLFPDWQTNSNFTTVSPITATRIGPDGMPTAAASSIANPDLRIDLAFEMIDTVFGVKMGTSPASAAAGSSVDSNRYVLKQTYTVTNTSSQSIQDLNLFQFMHGLNAVQSLYDSRSYAGPFQEYRFDTTQIAIDTTYTATRGTTFRDYINFASKVAPVAFDNGRYGIEGVDNHATGKPSVGIHYSVESDSLANVDYFAPAPPFWVAGAQKYALGALASGGSVSFDVLLSIRTGTVVGNTGTCSGSANGGSSHPGGVDFSFENVIEPGSFFVEYSVVDHEELIERVTQGEFSMPDFGIPGPLQLFELEFDGEFDGDVTLVVGYDDTLLPPGFDPMLLDLYHFAGGAWSPLGGTVDPPNSTITVVTDRLSYFAVGIVPEPACAAVAVMLALPLLLARKRRIVF